jgi:hypothetical protein
LRDLDRAQIVFSIDFADVDICFGPDACKYLDWMTITGIGAPQDDARAKVLPEQSCFTPSGRTVVDAEGCELLEELLIATDDPGQVYRAYLAFTIGCLEDIASLCITARQIAYAASVRSDAWLQRCDELIPEDAFTGAECAGLPRYPTVIDIDPAVARQELEFLQSMIKLQVLYLDEDLSLDEQVNWAPHWRFCLLPSYLALECGERQLYPIVRLHNANLVAANLVDRSGQDKPRRQPSLELPQRG